MSGHKPLNREATKSVNTAMCWEVGAKTIVFTSGTDLSLLSDYLGVAVKRTTVMFDRVRVRRTMQQFKIFVGSNPLPLNFPFESVVKIYSEEGIIWRSD